MPVCQWSSHCAQATLISPRRSTDALPCSSPGHFTDRTWTWCLRSEEADVRTDGQSTFPGVAAAAAAAVCAVSRTTAQDGPDADV